MPFGGADRANTQWFAPPYRHRDRTYRNTARYGASKRSARGVNTDGAHEIHDLLVDARVMATESLWTEYFCRLSVTVEKAIDPTRSARNDQRWKDAVMVAGALI